MLKRSGRCTPNDLLEAAALFDEAAEKYSVVVGPTHPNVANLRADATRFRETASRATRVP